MSCISFSLSLPLSPLSLYEPSFLSRCWYTQETSRYFYSELTELCLNLIKEITSTSQPQIDFVLKQRYDSIWICIRGIPNYIYFYVEQF